MNVTSRAFLRGYALLGVLALQSLPAEAQPVRFVPITPCRAIDTRAASGFPIPFGVPSLIARNMRGFPLLASNCPLSPTASAFSLNVTVVPHGPLGYLTVWPANEPQPFVSTLNSPLGRVVSNAVIVRGGESGAVFFYATNATDLIVDINGYFDSTSISAGFWPMLPCRAVDTRLAAGPFGAPSLTPGAIRDFLLGNGPCPVPSNATAYSLNVTVVPSEPLGFLTLWPGGVGKPFVSTLNSFDGRVVATAALVAPSATGVVSTFATNRTDLVIDVTGFFGNGLPGVSPALYPVPPCRAVDTRLDSGAPLAAGTTRTFLLGGKCGLPGNAMAYALNITAVPEEPLGFLTVWPGVMSRPFVSTLNSSDGSVVANAAIVGATEGGAVNVFATNRTHVVIDVSGYFHPAPLLAPLPAPTPLTPADGTIFGNYPRETTVTWAPVAGATRYGVQWQVCASLGTPCWFSPFAVVTGTSCTFLFGGANPGRWRVWAWDDSTGRASVPSPWMHFRYTV